MSTNKTQNYNLHSWVPEDNFIRSEFNDNFAGIDTALKSLSDGISAEATARTAAVNAEKTAREQAVAAEATARTAAVNTEKTAREQAVTAEQNARVAAINNLTSAKAELVIGYYAGNGTAPRTIVLGFKPKAVLFMRADGSTSHTDSDIFGGLLFPGHPLKYRGYSDTSESLAEIVNNGFKINYQNGNYRLNDSNCDYYYIAVK